MTQLVTGDSRCFPEACARRNRRGWVIRLVGPAERVVVREVVHVGEVRARELATTTHDALDSLLRVGVIATPARAARALARHTQQQPMARFLCHHGLPPWHAGANPCPAEREGDGVRTLDLGQVRVMTAGLRGLEELARHVVADAGPAGPGQVAAALHWPILPDYLRKPVLAETARDDGLVQERCRQVVATSLQVLQDSSRLRHETRWVTPHRLRPLTYAYSDLALYVHAFTERLLALTG